MHNILEFKTQVIMYILYRRIMGLFHVILDFDLKKTSDCIKVLLSVPVTIAIKQYRYNQLAM